MKCEEAIAAVIDERESGNLVAVASELNAHLLNCDKCRKEVEEIRLLLNKMENTPLYQPSANLATAFYDQLRADTMPGVVPKRKVAYLQIAAAVIFILFGAWLTKSLTNHETTTQQGELSALKNEVRSMREKMILGLLQNESASQRIQAAAYVQEVLKPDKKVIQALLKTLDDDQSTNVRLAALYALQDKITIPLVRDGLAGSLKKQHEPVIQVLLIRLLTMHKVHGTNKTVRELLKNNTTNPDVKQEAQKSIQEL